MRKPEPETVEMFDKNETGESLTAQRLADAPLRLAAQQASCDQGLFAEPDGQQELPLSGVEKVLRRFEIPATPENIRDLEYLGEPPEAPCDHTDE